MSDFYDNFEKRFTNSWFSAGWVEVEAISNLPKTSRKDLAVLQAELQKIQDDIEKIAQTKLRLANLAKFYEA